jgi:hypothetical protein
MMQRIMIKMAKKFKEMTILHLANYLIVAPIRIELNPKEPINPMVTERGLKIPKTPFLFIYFGANSLM